MKKIKLSVAGLMLCGLSYSQSVDSIDYINARNYDTIANGIAGKIHFEFNYVTSKIVNKIITEDFEDAVIEIKENQVLYVDLFDNCTCNKHQDINKVRKITVYYRDSYVKKYWGSDKIVEYMNESGDSTLRFLGKDIEKVIVHKPGECENCDEID